MNVIHLLNDAAKAFAAEKLASPRLDAEVLLARYLHVDRVALYKDPDRMLTSEETAGFQAWIDRRRAGEPVAYITGRKEFWSLDLDINKEVLIPRPDTEILVEEILKEYAVSDTRNLRLLDVGCGSGAIVIALATELKNALFEACDISETAVALALRNARNCDVDHRIAFRVGDLFAPLSGLFDGIVSNPPYIDEGLYQTLSREVKDFEPPTALLGGPDGLIFHRRLIREGKAYLKEGGRLYMEMGAGQADKVAAFIRNEPGYGDIVIRQDYGGIERCISARRIN